MPLAKHWGCFPNDKIANIPFNNGKTLTSFWRQCLYLPIKHKGWNSHVEPQFRLKATFFHIEILFPIKMALAFLFCSIIGRLSLRQPARDATWLTWPIHNKKKRLFCWMPMETMSLEIRVHAKYTQCLLPCMVWCSWNEMRLDSKTLPCKHADMHTPQRSSIILLQRQTSEPADWMRGTGWSLQPISQGQTGAQPLSWLLPHHPAQGDFAVHVSLCTLNRVHLISPVICIVLSGLSVSA